MNSTADRIRDEFTSQKVLYDGYAGCLQRLIDTLLKENNIIVHSLESRVKDAKSLHDKLNRPGKNYNKLSDITDLVGLRIITYLPEDVDKVAAIIDKEFTIDRDNSVGKRFSDDPYKFGYASLHKVCSLKDQRVCLPEYARYKQLKTEIQIRTILQHAWAEIEHDLGYKSNFGVPAHLKRRFARLAALLEAADEDFMRLKNDLSEYGRTIRQKLTNRTPGIPLDNVTLKMFIDTNSLLKVIEETSKWKNQTYLEDIEADGVDKYVKDLRQLGIESIDAIANALEAHKEHFSQAMRRCEAVDYGYDACGGVSVRGWSIWTLLQLLCADKTTKDETIAAMNALGLNIPDSLDSYADSLRAIVRNK
jgi:putative GTP pyrophosphokinase